MKTGIIFALASLTFLTGPLQAKTRPLQPADIFNFEWASDPQLSPDGQRIVFVRNSLDINKDHRRAQLWQVDRSGRHLEQVVDSDKDVNSPQFSPDGTRLAFASDGQIKVRDMRSGLVSTLTRVTDGVQQFAWSPNGAYLAFVMNVPAKDNSGAELPTAPKGAEWAPPVKVITRLLYRADGAGVIDPGFSHVFIVSANGGAAKQITSGDFNHGGFAWAADNQHVLVNANRSDDWEYQPNDNEIWEFALDGSEPKALTNRRGPDNIADVSADGRYVAYTGFDDQEQFYQVSQLYVLDRQTGTSKVITPTLDRDVQNPQFSANGKGLYFQFDDQGDSKIGYVSVAGGSVETITAGVGGAEFGRPYGAGSAMVNARDEVIFTSGDVYHLADVALIKRGQKSAQKLTGFNQDLVSGIELGKVETQWTPSGFDQLNIQSWLVYPPGFDKSKKYPLLLEIHGGPVANYGGRFAPETQLYAAKGYVVVYANPRGSDSYGQKFGNAIHHDYPNHDYDDLMSVVDAVIAKGFVDTNNLFVTGGSGGGVLTSWIVGHTERFRAAVVAKPVINWMSFALTSDGLSTYYRYWFEGFPWDHADSYLRRSPLMYVGHVTTPTMLIVGESDLRTPIAESEQFYHALKLRKVPTQMVRIPGASHGINTRPSNMLAQVLNTIAWFEKYKK
jgi:dipeptidyl aminopeptidase/acylaminoacyl peptidase